MLGDAWDHGDALHGDALHDAAKLLVVTGHGLESWSVAIHAAFDLTVPVCNVCWLQSVARRGRMPASEPISRALMAAAVESRERACRIRCGRNAVLTSHAADC